MDVITSPSNPAVRAARKLARPSSRARAGGRFLLEGPEGIRAALEAGHVPDSLLATERAAARHAGLVNLARQRGAQVTLVAEPVLSAWPPPPPPGPGRGGAQRARPLEALPPSPRLVCVLAEVRDPGNAGTVLRAADAFGADAVVTTAGSVDPESPKAVRAAAGSLFHLPVVAGVPWPELRPPCATGACAWSAPTRTPTPPSTRRRWTSRSPWSSATRPTACPPRSPPTSTWSSGSPWPAGPRASTWPPPRPSCCTRPRAPSAEPEEAALADSEAYLEALPDAVVVVDAEGRIAYANAAAERLARAGRDELAGGPSTTPCPCATAPATPGGPARSGCAASPGSAGSRCASCTWSPAASRSRSTSPPASSATPPAGSSRRSACRDASARRQPAGRAHLHPRPRAALPLTSVKGFTSTLLHRWERFSDEQKRQMLATVNMDADRVTRLIRELLDVSRIDAGRLELRRKEFDLAAMAEGIVGRFDLQHDRHSFQLTFPDGFPRVYADPDKIEQVLTNLVENAVKYSDGGPVTVTGQVTDAEVEVAVHDQGGVPADQLPLIFTKFYRRAGPGRPAAPGSACSSPAAWSRPTTAASGPTRPPARAPPCDFACPAGPGAGRHHLARHPARAGRPRSGRDVSCAFREELTMPTPDLDAVVAAGRQAIAGATDLEELREAEQAHLARRSALGEVQRSLGGLDEAARRDLGRRVNQARTTLQAELAARRAELEAERDRPARGRAGRRHPARPGPPRGAIHPVTRTIDEIVDIFVGLGYRVAEGPEVETDWYNFQALNIPPTTRPAPCRTASTWPRATGARRGSWCCAPRPRRCRSAPCRPAAAGLRRRPGRCYRADTPDATHVPVFNQIEVLAVDRGLTMADMKGTLLAFARAYFGEERQIRLRPSYFPFVEPGAEVDVSCFICGGTGAGCRTCRGEGWIELLGAGMVHPNVLRAGATTPTRSPASPPGPASSGPSCSARAWPTCAP